MYLFYMDESGDPNGWNFQDNFVLAGIAVHEGQVRRLSGELDDVQRRFFPGIAVSLEFHAQHIFGGKSRFRTMASQQRTDLLNAAYDVTANARFPNLVAFITAIHVSAVTNQHQALRDCLEDICERFNTFLVRQFRAGYPDKGMLIMDRSGRERRIRELMSTSADRQRERDEILRTRQEDVRKMAEMVAEVLKKNVLCVFGNEKTLTDNKEIFDDLIKVIE